MVPRSSRPLRVLLTESDSLTAREFLTVLGGAVGPGPGLRALGFDRVEIHAMGSGGLSVARFSRWCHAVHRAPAPAVEPVAYLRALAGVTAREGIDVVLATHEQAWLAAGHPGVLPAAFPLVAADGTAFARVQGKAAFARTCDELGLPRPEWAALEGPEDLGAVGFPCWVKSEWSTAGRGVARARDLAEATVAAERLGGFGAGLMVQAEAPGRYAQVAALFDHGRPLALHCTEQLGLGAGGSAAARIGVVHPEAGRAALRLGRELGWHGGLTVDYLHTGGRPQFIECNPRTVEPGNAAASGVDLPTLTIALTLGGELPGRIVTGRPGVRTRSAMALMLGAAEHTGRRRDVVAVAADAVGGRGPYRGSREVLTPILRDPPSLLPAAAVGLGLTLRPALVARIGSGVVARYSAASRNG